VASPSTQALGFPAVWLRHNCPCPDCRDPVTGQRLVEITQISNGPWVTVTAEFDASVEVTFAPDGHRSVFSRAWLASSALDVDGGSSEDGVGVGGVGGVGVLTDADLRTEDGKALWRATPASASAGGGPLADMSLSELSEPGLSELSLSEVSLFELAAVPAADWAGYLAEDSVRASVLDAVVRYGAGLLRGVPASAGMVTAVAETFGHVRETNYGRIFDVRVVADPANLAFTSRAIAPHTDNPYRDPVPTLQLLHCLRDASVGGDTVLVDGFAAAAALRAADPASFGVLTSTPIPFAYVDKETSLTASHPLISLTPRGRITGVRLNNRSMQPVRMPPAEVEAVYGAYRAWAEMVARPEFTLHLRLTPGDCLVFDNTRILHARTAFAPAPPASSGPGPGGPGGSGGSGERHLQGCYADIDGLLSTLAVLRRGQTLTTRG
jgi:gamma-butyrobetaine dioxygenase